MLLSAEGIRSKRLVENPLIRKPQSKLGECLLEIADVEVYVYPALKWKPISDGFEKSQPHQLSPGLRWAFAVSGFRSTPSPGLSLTGTNPCSI